MNTTRIARAFALLLLVTFTLHAQVPQIINYQGRVAVGTVNFNGSGAFKFALVNAAGTTTFWSNDGTSTAGSQPTAAVTLTVTKGLYSVLLGDTTLANMTAIPNSVFANADVRLRVWFNDGTNGSQLLTPDQRLAAVGYAMVAGSVPDGSITSAKIATGAVTNTQLATNAVQAANIAAGAVGNGQLASGLTFGGITIGTFSGIAAALTDLNASQLASGTVADARLSTNVALLAGNQTFTGRVGIGTSPNSKLHVNVALADAVPGLRVQIGGSSKLTVGSNGGLEGSMTQRLRTA